MGCTSCAQKYNALKASRNQTTSPSTPQVVNKVRVRTHRGIIRKPAAPLEEINEKPKQDEPIAPSDGENTNPPD